jgi:hypothetical protein
VKTIPFSARRSTRGKVEAADRTADAIDFLLFADAQAPRRSVMSVWPCDVTGSCVPIVKWVSDPHSVSRTAEMR